MYNILDCEYKKEIIPIKPLCLNENISFEELIKGVQNGFEFWRYIYEDNNKKFEKQYSFQYSREFLETYLPIILKLAKKHKTE